jgi:hypothetical protein
MIFLNLTSNLSSVVDHGRTEEREMTFVMLRKVTVKVIGRHLKRKNKNNVLVLSSTDVGCQQETLIEKQKQK